MFGYGHAYCIPNPSSVPSIFLPSVKFAIQSPLGTTGSGRLVFSFLRFHANGRRLHHSHILCWQSSRPVGQSASDPRAERVYCHTNTQTHKHTPMHALTHSRTHSRAGKHAVQIHMETHACKRARLQQHTHTTKTKQTKKTKTKKQRNKQTHTQTNTLTGIHTNISCEGFKKTRIGLGVCVLQNKIQPLIDWQF